MCALKKREGINKEREITCQYETESIETIQSSKGVGNIHKGSMSSPGCLFRCFICVQGWRVRLNLRGLLAIEFNGLE